MIRFAAILLACIAMPANAAISFTLAANYDNTRTTQYPNGDKPQGVGNCPPTGYTGLNLTGGGGTICDDGSTGLDFIVTGLNSIDDARIIYQDAGAGEVQVEGQILNTFSGSTENNAAIGSGIRESTAATSWVAQCKSLQTSSTAIQCQYGLAASPTSVNCAASGTTRPEWVAVTYYPTNSEVKGFTSSDGVTWTECFSTTRTMSDVIAYFIGGSKSATVSLTADMASFALLTEIDAYNETPGGGGSPPVLTSPIPDQTGSQNVAYSLTFSTYFTGATSYSLGSAFPGALTETSDGVLAGTPNATDASSSPYSRDLCATNASGTTCDSVSFSFSAVPGDVLTVSAGTTAVNCNTYESGGVVDPGDILQLAAGTRTVALTLSNCHGNSVSSITVRNNPTGGSAAIFSISTSPQYFIQCNNCTYVTIDGLQGWSGQSTAKCGISKTDAFPTENSTPCGIQLRTASGGQPQAFIDWQGVSSNYVMKGIEIDGNNVVGGDVGTGISCNDNSFTNGWSGSGAYSGDWRQDITIEQNWIHDTGVNSSGEGIYCGANAIQDALPIRRLEVRYNLVKSTGRECINVKYLREGPNLIHHNVARDCAPNASVSQARGINVTDGGDVDIYNNIVDNTQGAGIAHLINSANSGDPPLNASPFYINIYNNIIWSASGYGIQIRSSVASEDRISPALIYNNTIVDSVSGAISYSNSIGTCTASDNILAGSTTAQNITGCTSAGNTSIATANFGANFVNAGANNYELLSGSTACSAASSATAPATDYEDDSRPEGVADDDGADEATACP